MTISVKPTSYTVNTGHALAPTHLWMCDEGTGTTVYDQGTGTAADLTFGATTGSGPTWATDDDGGACLDFNNANQEWMTALTSLGITTSASFVVWVKNPGTHPASATSAVFPYMELADKDATNVFFHIGINPNTGRIAASASNTTNNSNTFSTTNYLTTGGNDTYNDATARLVIGTFETAQRYLSVDGSNGVDVGTTSAAIPGASDRFTIGVRANSQTTARSSHVRVIAAWVYADRVLNNTEIASLYNDPWQFLDTGSIQAFQYQNRVNTLLRM